MDAFAQGNLGWSGTFRIEELHLVQCQGLSGWGQTLAEQKWAQGRTVAKLVRAQGPMLAHQEWARGPVEWAQGRMIVQPEQKGARLGWAWGVGVGVGPLRDGGRRPPFAVEQIRQGQMKSAE